MRSADESDTNEVKIESHRENQQQQGEASLHSDRLSGVAVPPASSIANLTTALLNSSIPLTVFQNHLSLSAPVVVTSTFRNADQSFVEFNGQGCNQVLSGDFGLRFVADSSFKPPVVIGGGGGGGGPLPLATMPPIKRETDVDSEFSTSENESGSNQEWPQSGGSMAQSDESAVDYSLTAPNYNSADSAGAKSAKKMRTSTGSRRSGKDLTPEEDERRKLRRERNKLAAAKCRQKRVDQTNTLLAETQVLEDEGARLEEEIKKYQQQKEELEFILEAHRLHCGLGKHPPPPPSSAPAPVARPASLPPPLAPPVPPPPAPLSHEFLPPPVKVEGSEKSMEELRPPPATTTRVVSFLQRPTSFPLVSRSLAVGSGGLPISTPSSGGIIFTLGLDSMLDGHTGLTPITGVPSLVVQTPQNPPAEHAQPGGDNNLTPSSALMSL